jgi:hypothetical protein
MILNNNSTNTALSAIPHYYPAATSETPSPGTQAGNGISPCSEAGLIEEANTDRYWLHRTVGMTPHIRQ